MSFDPKDYFDLTDFAFASLFDDVEYVWDALARIRTSLDDFLRNHDGERLLQGEVRPGAWIEGTVYLGKGAVVEPGAYVMGPTVIGDGAQVRHGAYVRGDCIIGPDCVVGHGTEIKHSVMLDGSHAPHLNYVGDSIIGRRVNLGAGTILGNLKGDGSAIDVVHGTGRTSTGLRKLGAIIGDDVSTGCNAVTSPGTLIGPDSIVYAGAVVHGVYPRRSIIKLRQRLEVVEREERRG